jgi:hypothetical protein
MTKYIVMNGPFDQSDPGKFNTHRYA